MSIRSTKSRRGITTPRGFRAAGGCCGVKPSGDPDLALIVADELCPAAGVFTTSQIVGAPVVVSKQHLRRPGIRAIICNSGQANVCTERQGIADARSMCAAVAQELGCKRSQVLVCSTGVIGPRLQMAKITSGIAALGSSLARGSAVNDAVARGILTTDLVTKTAYRSIRLDGKLVHLAGVAKGSGMIAPNMATMLAFITTDAKIGAPRLQAALSSAVAVSFNCISVDTDTSTSDSVLILASGAAGNRRVESSRADASRFVEALTDLCQDLAYQIVCDGEGATKVFYVDVTGARSGADADRVGRAVTGSPLVKTAVHGSDPNWGRVLMAIGKSGATVKGGRITLHIGTQCVLRQGVPVNLTLKDASALARTMKQPEITFKIDLGLGKGQARWLGCDLSSQYVSINAEYTT
jgi:glutamate N-acetyltransferase/amino-acid N-acetyltransferase